MRLKGKEKEKEKEKKEERRAKNDTYKLCPIYPP
jgi:hypothetical protein